MTRTEAERWAALVGVLVGGPLLFLFARATLDGQVRSREAPLRAVLGDQAYDALKAGQSSALHYMGNDLLAPDFTLRDRQGKAWRLRDHRGKVVVMNFWTTTCQPCVEEMPSIETLAGIAAQRSDLEVVSVSVDRTWTEVQTVLAPNSRLTVLLDPDKSVVRERFGTRLYPETWIIDRDGVIRVRVDGGRDWSNALSLDLIEAYL